MNSSPYLKTTNKFFPRILLILSGCLLAILLVVLGSLYLPDGIDWHYTYRPAALAFLSGKSPYSVDIFFSAPWSLLPLIPLAVLPENIGRAILFLLGLGLFTFTARRLGATPLSCVAFLLSPPVLHCLLNSNIEWMPLLGFVLPPQIGLFFLSIKPQIGIGVGIFWLVEAWRNGGFKEVVRVFWPISLALLVSWIVFGFWPLRFFDTLSLTRTYNASLWPISIPVGLTLLASSVRKRNIRYAMAASPCLSPYVLLHAWVGALAAIISLPIETIVAVFGLWILVLLRAIGGS
ncbi:hypothetical protein ATHL_01248 [Anaerolinea thermolimosa]|uniref:hypothetical protein n=1 Tax=Anaerolinea thermolimosa TaxID=229919 RepID=UPI0013B35845|nr:hypothetical protein [Anaerolinea thermolimosa]GAP06394.1 hypothetical protein ATHL_01248 [Anaerolinea thermolimosa]